jgi:hypothetical protein
MRGVDDADLAGGCMTLVPSCEVLCACLDAAAVPL